MATTSVPIAAIGPVTVATMIFREAGILYVTAIVKGTFSFDHDEPMAITTPEPIVTREAHRMNNPTRSVVATSDLVPKLPGADIVVLGQAHAPGGSASQAVLRLAVSRNDELLLEKTILVVGDRRGAEIKPFQAIPLVYEKAYGGPGFRDNPLGTGVLAGDPQPNFVDPKGPQLAIGFAPISRSWPSRTSMLSAKSRAALDGPIAEIPPGFDWRYFHAAPADQRLTHLVGDEQIVLENMHSSYPVLRLQLPGAQALLRVFGLESAPRVLSLRADTVRIDTDAELCTIVWRHSFRVNEAVLPGIRLLAGLSLPDLPVEWPVTDSHQGLQTVPASIAESMIGLGQDGTLIMEDRPSKTPFDSSTLEVADEDMELVYAEEDTSSLDETVVRSDGSSPQTTGYKRRGTGGAQGAPAPRRSSPEPAIERTMDLTDLDIEEYDP